MPSRSRFSTNLGLFGGRRIEAVMANTSFGWLHLRILEGRFNHFAPSRLRSIE